MFIRQCAKAQSGTRKEETRGQSVSRNLHWKVQAQNASISHCRNWASSGPGAQVGFKEPIFFGEIQTGRKVHTKIATDLHITVAELAKRSVSGVQVTSPAIDV